MDIALDVLRRVEVYDKVNILDVEASGRNIRRDQDIRNSQFKPIEVSRPLGLAEVSVQLRRADFLSSQFIFQCVRQVLGVAEYHYLGTGVIPNMLDDLLQLVVQISRQLKFLGHIRIKREFVVPNLDVFGI